MNDTNLTVTISGRDQGLADVLQSDNQRLGQLEQAFIRVQAQAKTTDDAHAHLSGTLKGHGDIVGDVAGHYRMMAAGLGAAGLEADAAAVKLDALTQAIRGVGNAAPELLAIGAAIAAGAVAFSLLKHAVDEAAKSQMQLVEIGALLKNDAVASGGGDQWKAQTQAIDEYTDALARNSTFSKTEFLSGVHEMLAYGMSYNDVVRSQAAAEDLAIARGVPLAEAENMLAMAYDGRTMALKRLGLVTADEAKNGIAYETILQRVEARMGGSAAAALDTYAGKLQNLGNITALAYDAIGKSLVPVLSAFVDEVRGGVNALDPLIGAFREWAAINGPELKAGIVGFADAIGAVAGPALKGFVGATEGALSGLAQFGEWLGDHKNDIGDFVSAGLSVLGDLKDGFTNVAGALSATFGPAIAALLGALRQLPDWINANHGLIEAFFTVTIGRSAVLAFLSLQGAATAAIAAMFTSVVGSEWWALLSMGFGLVSDALVGGLTPALWADVAAWWELAGAEAAATLGISAVVAALVAGGVYLWNNWDESLNAAGGLWTQLSDTVAQAASSVESSIAGMFDKLAWQANRDPDYWREDCIGDLGIGSRVARRRKPSLRRDAARRRQGSSDPRRAYRAMVRLRYRRAGLAVAGRRTDR